MTERIDHYGVANGIAYAANRGTKVINLSLGGGPSLTVKAAVDYPSSRGVLVACAAGNNAGTSPTYPAAYLSCLSVTTKDQNDNREENKSPGTVSEQQPSPSAGVWRKKCTRPSAADAKAARAWTNSLVPRSVEQ